MITIGDFGKLDLRVGKVLSVADHPRADKLYVLKVDVGQEERQLVAGLKPYMAPAELEGRQVVVVVNLEPAVLRGIESQGMLLAVDDGESVVLISPVKEVRTGAKVR